MVFYFLTSSALEIGSAVTVWSLKTLYNGIVYMISNKNEENEDNYIVIEESNNIKELREENRKILEEMKKIESLIVNNK